MKVLLCKPFHFSVPEKDPDNKHMDPANQPNPTLSVLQHNSLAEIYQALGLEVIFIPAVPELPDMTFTANCGLIIGKKVILSNFKPPRRRGETSHFQKFFETQGYQVYNLPKDLFFEGAGDAIPYKDKIICGYGFRTSRKALNHIEKIMEREVVPIGLIPQDAGRKNFYHFDTTAIVLEEKETFITYPLAFDGESLRRLEKLGSIEIASYRDAANLALNAAVIPRGELNISGKVSDFVFQVDWFLGHQLSYRGVVITSSLASRKLQSQIIRARYIPVLTHLQEFLKSGGGAFCLTKIL